MEDEKDEIITPENLDEILGDGEEVVKTNPLEEEEEEEVDIPATNPEEKEIDDTKKATDSSVVINDKEYTKEELEEIFHVGNSVREYQKNHPGFDPILLHRDYTQKAQRLAELEKGLKKEPDSSSTALQAEAGKSIEDVAKELGVNPEDVKSVQKIAKALGFIDANEYKRNEQNRFVRDYETTKQQKINEFIVKYPEYHPSQDKGDKNWSTLLEEFSLYKLPDDPTRFTTLLERAHRAVKGVTIEPMSAAKLLAQKKVNALGKMSGASGGASGKSEKKTGGVPPLATQYLKGFSSQELEDLFN